MALFVISPSPFAWMILEISCLTNSPWTLLISPRFASQWHQANSTSADCIKPAEDHCSQQCILGKKKQKQKHTFHIPILLINFGVLNPRMHRWLQSAAGLMESGNVKSACSFSIHTCLHTLVSECPGWVAVDIMKHQHVLWNDLAACLGWAVGVTGSAGF